MTVMRSAGYFILSIGLLFSTGYTCAAQGRTRSNKNYKNVIRFNFSNFLVFGSKNIVFGYERIVSPSQSFSINVGHAALPDLFSVANDSLSLRKQDDRTGFNVSADYRFYLKNENKYDAPHGVYLGPYVMFNKTRKDMDWTLQHQNGPTQIAVETDFEVLGLGVEMGYQFVVLKRVTIDMVLIGPGIADYKFDANIDPSTSPEDRTKLLAAIKQAVQDKVPGLGVALENAHFNSAGRLDTWALGFRYLIHIGYRF